MHSSPTFCHSNFCKLTRFYSCYCFANLPTGSLTASPSLATALSRGALRTNITGKLQSELANYIVPGMETDVRIAVVMNVETTQLSLDLAMVSQFTFECYAKLKKRLKCDAS